LHDLAKSGSELAGTFSAHELPTIRDWIALAGQITVQISTS
jgi:hypothetical protein